MKQNHWNNNQVVTSVFILAVTLLLLILFLQVPVVSNKGNLSATPDPMADLVMPFIANQGQLDTDVAYYAHSLNSNVFITHKGELVYSLPSQALSIKGQDKTPSGWTLTETLLDANPKLSAQQASKTQVSSFIGNDPQKWRKQLPTFQSVSLGEVWPGIQLTLTAKSKGVEKIFTVEPGADLEQIRIQLDGADDLKLADNGALEIGTGFGKASLSTPIAWQEKKNQRLPVQVAYVVNGNKYGFQLGEHDSSLPVIIDPFLQSTYIGGSGFDIVYPMAIHPVTGDVYVAGETYSSNFTGVTGGLQTSLSGTSDFFVARFDSTLTTLEQATYLGGSGDEDVASYFRHGLAISAAGDVYLAAGTRSFDFPGTSGGAFPNSDVQSDGIIVKMNADLTSILQSTYYPGSRVEVLTAIALHPTTGDVYAVGGGDPAGLPGTAGGAQPLPSQDGIYSESFVVQFNSDLTILRQATYLGGNHNDAIWSIAVHPVSGEVYVAGNTQSSDFPGVTGGAQESIGDAPTDGYGDGFILRYSDDLTSVIQSTYFGGTQDDDIVDFVIHPVSGEVYITGWTGLDIPGASGGFQDTCVRDCAFVAKLNAGLTSIIQSSYLGGGFGFDVAYSIITKPVSNEIYVAGTTAAPNLAGISGGARETLEGGAEGFVSRIRDDLTVIHQSTFVGGNNHEEAYVVALHPVTGEIYVAGYTSSTSLPEIAGGAIATNPGGGGSGYVARIDSTLAAVATSPDINVTPVSHDYGAILVGNSSPALEVTITNTGTATLNVSDIVLADIANYSLDLGGGSNACNATSFALAAGANCTVSVNFIPSVAGGLNTSLTITSDDPDEATVTVDLTGTGSSATEPDVNVTPATHDYGSVETGTTSTAVIVNIANNGSADLMVSNISIGGVDATEFNLNLNSGSPACTVTNPTITPATNCQLSITFSPQTDGVKNATLTVDSDDPDSPNVDIPLTGTGVTSGGGGGGGSSGGCTVASNSPFDPMLPLMILFALIYLARSRWVIR